MPTALPIRYTVELFAPLLTLGVYSLRPVGEEVRGTLVGDFFRALRTDPGRATAAEAASFPNLLSYLADETDADLLDFRRVGSPDHGILRDEGKGAAALPPTNEYRRNTLALDPLTLHVGGGLRLNGFPAAARVLLLFGGGYKTIHDPRNCPLVAPAFAFSQLAATALRHPAMLRQWQCRGTTFEPTGEGGPHLWLPPAPPPCFR